MAMNSVQFQAGLSMSAFFDLYGTEPQCEAALVVASPPPRPSLARSITCGGLKMVAN